MTGIIKLSLILYPSIPGWTINPHKVCPVCYSTFTRVFGCHSCDSEWYSNGEITYNSYKFNTALKGG